MRIRHPEALDGVGGQCPGRVGLGGDTYDCGDGAAFDVSRSRAEALAGRYGVEVADIEVDDETDADPPDADESNQEQYDATPRFNPNDLTVSELRERLDNEDIGTTELVDLKAWEDDGKDRKTAKEAIQEAIDA